MKNTTFPVHQVESIILSLISCLRYLVAHSLDHSFEVQLLEKYPYLQEILAENEWKWMSCLRITWMVFV